MTDELEDMRDQLSASRINGASETEVEAIRHADPEILARLFDKGLLDKLPMPLKMVLRCHEGIEKARFKMPPNFTTAIAVRALMIDRQRAEEKLAREEARKGRTKQRKRRR